MSLKSNIISGNGHESTVNIKFILLFLKNNKSIAAVKFPVSNYTKYINGHDFKTCY